MSFNVSASKDTMEDPAFVFMYKHIDKINGVELDTQLTLKRPKMIDMKLHYDQVRFIFDWNKRMNE